VVQNTLKIDLARKQTDYTLITIQTMDLELDQSNATCSLESAIKNSGILKVMHDMKGECERSLEICRQNNKFLGKNDSVESFAENFMILLVISYMLKYFASEYMMYLEAVRRSKESVFGGEYCLSRLDFHLSSNQYAKPTLLLSAAFILVVTATFLRITCLEEDTAAALWKTWTYVSDPGPQTPRTAAVSSAPPNPHHFLLTSLTYCRALSSSYM
jgi:hypothetical protein